MSNHIIDLSTFLKAVCRLLRTSPYTHGSLNRGFGQMEYKSC